MSGARDHSPLGPSSAHRWMNCPGSVEAERSMPESSSEYAEEGTAAHALSKIVLEKNQDPTRWLGEEVEGVVITQDVVDAVRFYAEYVRPLLASATHIGVEVPVDFAPLGPPIPMFGTADVIAAQPDYSLDVVDAKYGRGVRVNAERNPQGLMYLLGAWIDLAQRDQRRAMKLHTFRIHIVQPRILDEEGRPSVSVWQIDLAGLKQFARDLLEAARRTQQQNAPRTAGDHCRWCRAKPVCPEFRAAAVAVARVEFTDLLDDKPRPPLPGELTREQIAAVLEHADLLRDWLSSVEAHALGEMERGRPVPGWARKPKRATRKWREEAAVRAWAESIGADPDDLYEPKLKSPAQVEKAVGRGQIPDGLVVAESSGYNLCRADDPKALPPAASDFDALL